MPGKNQVTLTFAGDSAQLERAIKKSESATKDMDKAFDRLGKSAKGAEEDIASLAGRTNRLERAIGKGGADMAAYRRDLDGVGDGFNDVEDRAMGAGNIINGVNDMFTSKDPATFAMGLSDTAAGIRYTVVPTLQDAGKSVKGLVDRFKAGGGAVGMFRRNMVSIVGVAGAVAGAVALVNMHMSDNARRQRESAARAQDWAERLKDLQGDVHGLTSEVVAADPELETLRRAMSASGMTADELATKVATGNLDLQAMGEAAGFSKGEMAALLIEAGMLTSGIDKATLAFEDNTNATGDATMSLQGYIDTVRAQTDPVFAAVNAMSALSESQEAVTSAQEAVNAAAKEHGRNSPEHVAALQALEAAEWRVAESSVAQESAMLELANQMLASGTSVAGVKAHMLRLAEQNGWTAGTVQTVINKLNAVPGHVSTTLTATNLASSVIEQVRSGISSLPRDVVVNIRAEQDLNRARARSGISRAGGGPVYAASGRVIDGPRGTDTIPAWLTPGEVVFNRAQQARLFDALNGGRALGGAGVTVIVQGSVISERQLMRLIRDELGRGGLGR